MLARALLAAGLVAVPVTAAAVEDALPLSPGEVRERWHSRLDDRHFTARIRLRMDLGGLREERQLLVWRDDEGDAERVMVRFEAPPDLRDVALLYLEQPDRPNDYFLYQPATRRIRRLPETVASDDVYGIDLEFLGFGVAQSEPTEVESMTTDLLGERAVYRLTERATRPNPRFERRVTWIDAETFIPLKTEHQRGDRTALLARTLETRVIQGTPTPTRIAFDRPLDGRHVVLLVEHVDYEKAIPEDYFSTLALIRQQVGAGARRADR